MTATMEIVLFRPERVGRRIVEAAVLERDAGSFAGWPIYWPESAEDRRRRDTMPRPPSLLAGEVVEAWWDRARGVVVGKVAAVDRLAGLLRRIPSKLRLTAELPPASRSRMVPGRGRVIEAIAADPEGGAFVLASNAGGTPTDVGRALVEAAQESRSATSARVSREPVLNYSRVPETPSQAFARRLVGGEFARASGARGREAADSGDWREVMRRRGIGERTIEVMGGGR